MEKTLPVKTKESTTIKLHTLKNRLIGFAVCMFMIPVCIVGFTIWQNVAIQQKNEVIVNNRLTGATAGLHVLSGLNRITSSQNAWLISGDKSRLTECSNTWREIVLYNLEQLKKGASAWEQQKSSIATENTVLIKAIEADIRRYKELHEQAIAHVPDTENTFPPRLNRILTFQHETLDRLRTAIKQLAANQQALLTNDVTSVTALTQEQNTYLYLQLFAALVISAGIGIILYHSILHPVYRLKSLIRSLSEGNIPAKAEPTSDEIGEMIQYSNILIDNLNGAARFSEDIGNGNLNSTFQAAGPEDKLGNALLTMRTKLQQLDAEDHKRNWITTGIASASELLRNTTQDTEELYNSFISFIIKYLHANQGAIFVIEQEHAEKPYLEMAACYAYNRKKYIQRKIEIGEGLVGQAVLEKDSIYMTDVPQGYVHITSGLGSATPGCILIVPLLLNDEVFGAIELASLQPFEAYQIDFVKKIAESVASVISSTKVSKRTSHLLAETQFQAEEMRAQEEEMRQNMEELSATQEEMKRMMLEVQAQSNIINSVAIVSKTDIRGNITYVNDEFLKWSKYTLEEVMGKNHRFLKSGDQDDAIFEDLWKTISKGKIFRGEIKNKAKDGSFYWVDAIIAPVMGEDGKPKEYIAQRFVINDQKEKQSFLQETLRKAQEQEEELRMLADNITGAVYKAVLKDSVFTIQYISSGIEEISGYTTQELEQNGTLLRSLVANGSANNIERAIKGAMQFGSDYEVDYELTTKAGTCCTVRETGKFGKTLQDGSVIVTGYLVDVSRELESAIEIQALLDSAEEQNKKLKEQEEELATNLQSMVEIQEQTKQRAFEVENRLIAINQSGIASIEFDLDGTIKDANKAFLDLMGYELQEIVGKHHKIFVNPEEWESESYLKFWQELKAGLAQPGVYTRYRSTGDEVVIKGAYSVITDAEKNPYRILKLATEISEAYHLN